MRSGDFARAWAITDQDLPIFRLSGQSENDTPRHFQRIWRGEELRDRRVLVRCYHGLGDTIQFVRFIPALRRLAREVIVWCQPELLSLVERVDGADRVLALHDGEPEVAFDVDIEIMEVPHAIRAGREQFEMRSPYLKKVAGEGGESLAGMETVTAGLVWQGGDWDRRRAVPAALLKRLRVPGTKLYSLQRGPASNEAAQIGAVDISTPDIETLAHTLKKLDVLICVDTMVAHLSGALGCETWLMLHADCDWRWPSAGHHTFWYPTMKLFHQRVAGEWDDVVGEVRKALLNRLEQRVMSGSPAGLLEA
jgi:hypothetical protein